MALEDQVGITNGPGRSDLIFALFDKKLVTFTLAATEGSEGFTTRPIPSIQVTSIEREDGSGNRWMFKGFIPLTDVKVSGYYDSQTRTGWLVYKKKPFA